MPNSAEESAIDVAFQTSNGRAFVGPLEDFLTSSEASEVRGKVDLILTSPPFPLRRKKAYGNLEGEEYLEWISDLMARTGELLSEDGSLVIEIGNSWEPSEPVMSLLPLQALLRIVEKSGFTVCQQFICNNPARLPGPAQWVTVNRWRLKDSYTHVWWLARTPWLQKPDNRRVLVPYSDSMKSLLRRRKYNQGTRPSGHRVGQGFTEDHGGAIASNVLQFPNTRDDENYLNWCRSNDFKPHPARMPRALVKFFVDFLTDPGDLVMDCFGGSLTTASVAESEGRRWVSTEMSRDYLLGALGRFSTLADDVTTSHPEFVEYVHSLQGSVAIKG